MAYDFNRVIMKQTYPDHMAVGNHEYATADSLATVKAVGYFNSDDGRLKQGNMLTVTFLSDEEGTSIVAKYFFKITSINNGVVTVLQSPTGNLTF